MSGITGVESIMLSACCVSALLLGTFGDVASASTARSVVKGNVRFQALSPSLIRMEYSPTASFVDDASVAVVGRDDWPQASVEAKESNGWLIVSTGKMVASYKLDSGPFSSSNLHIAWTDKSGDHTWKPGDKDDRNLGGVPASLDNRSMQTVTDPGPLSRSGYYLLDDSRSALFDKATDWVKPRPEKDSQDWYFLTYGSDYKSALVALSKLIGSVPMLPRYVFGSWFGSRAGYSADTWKMIVKQFRDEHLPLDVLVLDSDSTTSITWSGYDWDYEQMPDPKGFFEWTGKRGVKVTVNEHYGPLTRINDANFDTIRKAMGLPDSTKEIGHHIGNKKYADLFMNILHKPALDMGMAFWWQDGAATTDMEGLEAYLWTRHVEYEGSERITGKRTTTFCRLGPAVGSHRYGIFFTGDLTGIWESLPVLVPATIRGGNQLMPYMNNLCGGVFVVDLPVELYQRWYQFSAFSPIVWTHGLWGLRLPWEYGPGGEETYREFVGLRYALLPYIYTTSRLAYETGLPLVRGMYIEYPEQESSYKHDQQYMFGKDILVAPITEPGNGKPVNKEVFLPAGNDWFDYFTGDIYAGGTSIVHECPIERMPLFVRAGSIIPMAPKMDYSDQAKVDPLTLDVYAGKTAGEFKLYEDDGTSLDYRKGAFCWTTFTFAPLPKVGSYKLTIGSAKGTFKGRLNKRRYIVKVHGLLKPEGVTVNGVELVKSDSDCCGPGWKWDENSRSATIVIPRAMPTSEQVVVTINGAGTFADAVALQKVLNLRQQVRQAKRLMKLRDAELLGNDDIKKEPRVIRTTQEVEWELTALVDHPNGIGKRALDFGAMRKRVVDALSSQPFESNRTIPDIEPSTIAATKKIENEQFTPEQITKIEEILRGADLPAWLN